MQLEGYRLFYEILGELEYPIDQIETRRIKAVSPKKLIKGQNFYDPSYYTELLSNYFRLDSNLPSDYSDWIRAHKHFESKASKDSAFVTQLDQDVVETIFSFICSQNNHISRITSLVEKLCFLYGEKICTIDNRDYYNFPSITNLTKAAQMEGTLREQGFGYRSKFIEGATKEIFNRGGTHWLNSLAEKSYKEAHEELMKLPGIGPKVADCICLMSLNFLEAVPVDTHIIQVAQHYIQDDSFKKLKSLNLKMYRRIGDTFRSVYGIKAGVAQTVIFCKELDKFAHDSSSTKKKLKKTTSST